MWRISTVVAGWRRLAGRYVVGVDALIAVGAGGSIVWSAVAEAAGRVPSEPVGWLGVGLVVVAARSLVLRRRAPVVAFGLVFGATLGFLLCGSAFGPVVQLAGLAMYSVGAWTPTRTSAGVCLAAVAGYLPLELVYRWAALPLATTVLVTAGWLALPWLLAVGRQRRPREAQPAPTRSSRRRGGPGRALAMALAWPVGAELRDPVGEGRP